MDEFVYLPDFQVIICKKCQYAVLPSEIEAHFIGKKHRFPKNARNRIIQEVAKVGGLIQNEEELGKCEFPFPPPTSKPIAALGPPETDGLRCTKEVDGEQCPYVCRTERGMREHSWEEHQWKSDEKGGRPRKQNPGPAKKVPWQTGIHCQRFFKKRAKSRYFEVHPVPTGPPPTPRIASRKSQFEAAKKEIERAFAKAEEEEQRQIKETDEAKEPNPWLRRVGCVGHLASVDRKQVRTFVAPVNPEKEPGLAILDTAFEWLIQDAQYHAVRDVVGLHALFEANKKEVEKETNMPFDSWMDITTIERYVEVWKQLLLFVFRAEEVDIDERPPYMLTEEQQTAMQVVRDRIDGFQQWKEEQDSAEEDPEDEGVGDDGSVEEDREEGREEDEEDEGFTDGISDEEIRRMREIQREILRFCIVLLDHPLQDDEYKSAIISGLAVLMIKGEKGWQDAEDFTTKYSAVIKLARLMVVQEAYEQRQEQIQEYQTNGLTEKEAGTMATSYYGLVKQFVGQFMTMAHGGRDPTPMQWIYQTRSYGFKIRYTTPAAGKIQWIREEVLYPGTRVQMSQLRSMVHGLIGEARDELFGELMMVRGKFEGSDEAKPVPPIDWENTVDQPSETKVGWSFLDDERNKFTVHKEWWLFERMYQEQTLREQFLDVDGKLKEGAGEAYQRHIVRFLEVLLILIHICAGQPSRAPEILGLRWKNTENGGVRNVVIEDGLVGVVAQYHKGYRSSGNIKIIHRYLPKEVGELLVYYLWLVLPFWEKLQCQMTGEKVCSAFIWGDAEKKEHRQWTGPRRKREAPRQERRDARREGRREARANRSRADKKEKRTQSSWTSERVRKIMQEASARWMGRESILSISAWRQIAIAISRRFCRKDQFEDDQGKLEGEDGWDEDNTAGDDPWDLQAGHGTHIAGMIYARELMEGNDSIISRREKFRRISQSWHRFLEFASSRPDPVSGGTKRKRSSVEDEMDEVQAVRWKKLRTVDIQQALEDVCGRQAEFRGLQKPALEAIIRNESPVLVVMGTSVGKTILFQIPAKSVDSGTTVVITPLVSLQNHMVERCRKVGISCVQWDSQQVSKMRAQVVIVTPESAVSKAFGSFLNELQGRRELVRIVYDECHTVMDSTAEFRPKIRQLGMLAMREVQMVFLTATLPPRLEAEFMRIMKIDPREVYIFRAPTTRPNITYSVWEYEKKEDETEAVCRLVQEKLEQYTAPSKIIVYGGTIAKTKELSNALDCHEYYREVGDREEKEEIMQRWQHGNGRLIVATNAFGLGIDAPDVRVVIHVGAMYQMRNYVQESGRGGRDGQRSEAIVVMAAGKQEALQKNHDRARVRRQPWKIQSRIRSAQEEKQIEWDKMERFLSGEKCRRVYLDIEMDGRGDDRWKCDGRARRERCEEGEERCDVCEKGDIMMERLAVQKEAYAKIKQAQEEQWIDSGIDVPSSSIADIPSSRVGVNMPSSSIAEHPISSIPSSMPLPTLQDTSRRSSISFDDGFAADTMTRDEQETFTVQQAQRRQQRWQSVVQEQDEGKEVWDIESRLDSWVGKCPLCYVQQCNGKKVDVRHPFEECPDKLRGKVAEEIKKLEGINFDKFASCTYCRIAQKVCSRWEETYTGSSRFRQAEGSMCQYPGIIGPAVAAIMITGPLEVVRDQVFTPIKEEGIWGRGDNWQENQEDVAEVMRVIKIWFGKKII